MFGSTGKNHPLKYHRRRTNRNPPLLTLSKEVRLKQTCNIPTMRNATREMMNEIFSDSATGSRLFSAGGPHGIGFLNQDTISRSLAQTKNNVQWLHFAMRPDLFGASPTTDFPNYRALPHSIASAYETPSNNLHDFKKNHATALGDAIWNRSSSGSRNATRTIGFVNFLAYSGQFVPKSCAQNYFDLLRGAILFEWLPTAARISRNPYTFMQTLNSFFSGTRTKEFFMKATSAYQRSDPNRAERLAANINEIKNNSPLFIKDIEGSNKLNILIQMVRGHGKFDIPNQYVYDYVIAIIVAMHKSYDAKKDDTMDFESSSIGGPPRSYSANFR